MCGIAVLFAKNSSQGLSLIEKMNQSQQQRGPDSDGVWKDQRLPLFLGHRRLSIIDLSVGGHQPMLSGSGRFCVSFNGEIYNYQELKRELEANGFRFRSTSDTEVLLAGVEQWGLEQTLVKAIGMFAIALWDTIEQRLFLARDRFGEKPLYYGWTAAGFAASSDLRALEVLGAPLSIDRGSVALLMQFNCIAAPHSIYREVKKLRPGHLLSLGLADLSGQQDASPARCYFPIRETILHSLANPFTGDETEALDLLEQALARAVKRQMISDVPLGAFLSGGTDSSLIVALMQKYGTGTTQTFSIGFQEAEFNEAPYARAVAEHLATKHTELEVTSAQALAVIPELPKIYSEPFADSSQIPTYLVAKLAREKVTVALSGDAGDELFGGYSRYRLFLKFWSAVGWLPASARERLGAIGAGFSQKSLGALGRLFGGKKVSSLGFKLHRGFEALSQPTEEALYAMLLSHWCPASEAMAGRENSYQTISAQFEQWSLPTGMLERMMLLDTLAYLPDDILVKVDRAAMAVSLETRVPFLDHELFALAWTLPSSFRLRGSSGKWALKKLLEKFLPKSLVYRPKQGFGVPIGEWLRGPLRAWAEALLDPSRIRQQGYLNSQLIGKYWSEHINGVRDWHYLLWDVLMFQAWLEERGHG